MTSSSFLAVVVLAALATSCYCDLYLHIPRGSNNRLDEANRDRANANRVFDSQNNNRGGYNVASEMWFEGSELEVSWTNQHGLGNNPNTPYNEVIMQMMCDSFLRDGTVTNRIQDEEWADLDYRYGRHESYYYYQDCKTRERNQGLFTASQNLKGDAAIYTRQNPNGNRNGFECPEERDYYPYWQPSPWVDIAILTNDESRCAYYQAESQNVKSRNYCVFASATEEGQQNPLRPISAEGCAAIGGNWTEVPSWNMPPPECITSPWTRDNHLGNAVGGYPAVYKFNVPYLSRTNITAINSNFSNTECVFRTRYNITTDDYTPWGRSGENFTDARFNDRDGLALGLTEKLGYEARFENNPQVDFGLGVEFQLAINTAQFGRTFQDRSHRMEIWPRPKGLEDVVIKNLNVQGKRGNIVQTFPGVEYDFMPNILTIRTDEYLHVHWSGSNSNPANNDGQGQQQSDRSNIAPMIDLGKTYPQWVENATLFDGDYHWLHTLGTLSTAQYGGELSELDDAGTHFDAVRLYSPSDAEGLIKLTKPGNYSYMCTRNNNFSNRGQKGRLIVLQGDDNPGSESEDINLIVGAIGTVVVGLVLVSLALMTFGKTLSASAAQKAAAADPSLSEGLVN